MYNVIKTFMNTIFEKENWTKTSNRTGIQLATKEMVFATWFILNIAHYAQEAHEQIDGNILKEFFLACFKRMNTSLRPLFNINPYIRFQSCLSIIIHK